MDLKDQLKNLFPNHTESNIDKNQVSPYSISLEEINCKFEKRKGKPITIIDGFNYKTNLKYLAKEIKVKFSVGGSFKNDSLIIQGNYRNHIMEFLKSKGYKVKRVGG